MPFAIEYNNWSSRESFRRAPSINLVIYVANEYTMPLCPFTDVLGTSEYIMVVDEVRGKTGHPGGIFECFEENVVCVDDERGGGTDMIGKPVLDIFLVAAKELLGRNICEPG